MFEPDSTFLAGKVLKRSLPVMRPGEAFGEARLKRLLLPQGELAQFYDGDEGMRYLAFIALRVGNCRGNHYHKVKRELIYLIEGEVLLLVEDIESKLREAIPLRTGDLAFVPPGIAHALRPAQPGYAIECSPTRFDREDVYPHPLG